MTKKMSASWKLRDRLEERCIHSTADLVPLLAERGVHLSRMQVYRLAAQEPQRISLDILAALCDILECTPNDLISISVSKKQQRKAVGETRAVQGNIRPIRANIRKPHDDD